MKFQNQLQNHRDDKASDEQDSVSPMRISARRSNNHRPRISAGSIAGRECDIQGRRRVNHERNAAAPRRASNARDHNRKLRPCRCLLRPGIV